MSKGPVGLRNLMAAIHDPADQGGANQRCALTTMLKQLPLCMHYIAGNGQREAQFQHQAHSAGPQTGTSHASIVKPLLDAYQEYGLAHSTQCRADLGNAAVAVPAAADSRTSEVWTWLQAGCPVSGLHQRLCSDIHEANQPLLVSMASGLPEELQQHHVVPAFSGRASFIPGSSARQPAWASFAPSQPSRVPLCATIAGGGHTRCCKEEHINLLAQPLKIALSLLRFFLCRLQV